MRNDKLRSYLHLNLIVLIWGFTAVLGALISLGAIPLVWWRMMMASLLILFWIRWRRKSLRVSSRSLITMIGAGVIIALHWLTFFGAIKAANVSVTLAMLSTGAFFTSILEPLLYRRKIIWYEIILGLLVVSGLYIIFEVETEYMEGMILALISALLSALFALINGKLAPREDAAVISFYELLCGALAISVYLGVLALFGTPGSGFSIAFFRLTGMDLGLLFLLASVCTPYAFIGAVAVMRHLSPYTVMLTTNLEPVYGILLAFLILGQEERMEPGFYYGAGIVLVTVIINGLLKTRRKIRKHRRVTS